jgi:hypothetical protein
VRRLLARTGGILALLWACARLPLEEWRARRGTVLVESQLDLSQLLIPMALGFALGLQACTFAGVLILIVEAR